MRITVAMKREIAARLGIPADQFEAHLRREREKRRALKAMTASERRQFKEVEVAENAHRAALHRAARLKRDGITVHGTRIDDASDMPEQRNALKG